MTEQRFEIDYIKEQKDINKFANFYVILDCWLKLCEEGKSVCSFFERRHYKKIAIYGMASLGKHLKKQLENSNIDVIYTIDNGIMEYDDNFIDITDENMEFPVVDVMVITPVVEFEKIRDLYKEKVRCDIISLEEVILSV